MNQIFLFACCLLVQTTSALTNAPPIKNENPTNSHADVSTSICQLAREGKRFNGTQVRLQGIYITDLHHGAILKDQRCPSVFIEEGETSEMVDASVKLFNDALYTSLFNHTLGKVFVDVSGKYIAGGSSRATANTPRGVVTPHGIISIEKVWSFKRLRKSR